MSLRRFSGPLSLSASLLLAACSGGSDGGDTPGGAGSASGGAQAVAGSGNPGAGANPTAGASPVAGAGPIAGAGGTTGSAGAGGSTVTAGAAGSAPTAGAGGGGDVDPPAPRPINVTPGNNYSGNYNGQPMFVNKSKPTQGKLVLLLGGICTGTGAGGFESFVKAYGFHVFAPKTDTCVNSAPDQYKNTIKTMPNDIEANRQVADARRELWDGVDRVNWVTVKTGESIVEQTVGAIKYGVQADPGGDWGYFLNADGSLRTTDVYVVGYSWGSQTWAMLSSYVRFGRVIITSGPVSEGFPNGEWMVHPAATATPGDRKYMLADLKTPYPSEGDGNMDKYANVIKAGWPSMVTSVTPTSVGPYTPSQHLFAMIGSNNVSPGGHTVFCTDNAQNGWLPVCKHVLGVQ